MKYPANTFRFQNKTKIIKKKFQKFYGKISEGQKYSKLHKKMTGLESVCDHSTAIDITIRLKGNLGNYVNTKVKHDSFRIDSQLGDLR